MITFSKKFHFLSTIFFRLRDTTILILQRVIKYFSLFMSFAFYSYADSPSHKENQDLLEKNPQYQGLKKLWQRYKSMGKDVKVPKDCLKNPIKKNYTKNEKKLIQRLFQLGFLPSDSADLPYQKLVYALNRFQKACNISPSSKIDQNTWRYLRRSLKNWRHHIWQNLQRWSKSLCTEPFYILVNIPAGLLYCFKDHRPIFISKVIVGKYDSPTVPFQNRIKGILTHPTWHIPENLAKKLKSNVGSRGYALSDAGSLIQRPGPHNPLGAIKFSFSETPIKSIIMHSTNKPHLFKEKNRFFSLGCIRVQEYAGLAKLLLSNKQWESFSHSIRNHKSQSFGLDAEVPISAAYITIWMDQEGYFRLINDFYDEDDEDADDEDEDDDEDENDGNEKK